MKKKTGILGVLIAILLVGIGYAAISAVTLTINGTGTVTPSDDNFKVVYTAGEQTSASTGVTATPATIGADGVISTSFTVSGMTKTGDTATLAYTITNKSPELKAALGTPSVTVSNTEYFSATSNITGAPVVLNPDGTATQVVTVTAIKTPVSAEQSTTVTITVVADPQN